MENPSVAAASTTRNVVFHNYVVKSQTGSASSLGLISPGDHRHDKSMLTCCVQQRRPEPEAEPNGAEFSAAAFSKQS